MSAIKASGNLHGHELNDIPVLNPGDWFGKTWLIEIGGSYTPLFLKLKQTKKGMKSYIYYRCSKYGSAGHPRVRLTEAELDQQMEEALRPLDQSCTGTCGII